MKLSIAAALVVAFSCHCEGTKFFLPLNTIEPQETFDSATVQWAREDNFAPTSGVSVSLDKLTGPVGQLRTVHWHSGTELHYLLEGQVRVQTLFNGYEEVFIQRPGDVFLTPEGYSHFFEKTSEEDVVMVNLFSQGKLDTFDLTESFGILRDLNPEVLAKTFGVDLDLIHSLHAHGGGSKKDGFPLPLPSYKYNPRELTSKRCFLLPDLDGSDHKKYGKYYPQTKVIWATAPYYPHLEGLGFAQIELEPGAMREPQWMGVGDELVFVVEGQVQLGVAGRSNKEDEAEKNVLGQYELGWVPHNFVSYIVNVGQVPAKVLLMYNTAEPEFMSLRETYSKLPKEVFSTMHRVDPEVLDAFAKLDRTPNPGSRFTADDEGCPASNKAKLRVVG